LIKKLSEWVISEKQLEELEKKGLNSEFNLFVRKELIKIKKELMEKV